MQHDERYSQPTWHAGSWQRADWSEDWREAWSGDSARDPQPEQGDCWETVAHRDDPAAHGDDQNDPNGTIVVVRPGDVDYEQLTPEMVRIYDFLRAIFPLFPDEADADARNSLPSLTDVERIEFGPTATMHDAFATEFTSQNELWTFLQRPASFDALVAAGKSPFQLWKDLPEVVDV